MKIVKERLDTFAHSYPASVAIVVVQGKEKVNAMAAAWHTPISFKPALYGVSIAPKRFTHNIILETKDFSLNFFSHEQISLIHKLGHTSGSKTDKFIKFNIETEPAARIKSPIIKSAFAAYECRLHDYRTYGDHTIFVGEIVAVHYEESAFQNGELIRYEKIRPALYIGDDNYITIDARTAISTKGISTEQ